MKTYSSPLSTAEEISNLAQTLKEHLREVPMLAVDTEFIRETTFFPQMEILQIASHKDSWLVDVQAFLKGKRFRPAELEPLLQIFEDPQVLKVLHAAQGDQECLYTGLGVVAQPSIDTAVAAALCGLGENVGLGSLLKTVLGVQLKKGHARTNWAVRPLAPQMIEYAHLDVEYLIQAIDKLLAQVEKLGRKEWALEQSQKLGDPKFLDPDPLALAHRLAKGSKLDAQGYAALVELMRWREKRVRDVNVPRRWIADDQVLLDLALVRPKDVTHLSAFRGINKGEIKNSGAAILQALERAKESPSPFPEDLKRPDSPTSAESQILQLLQCYLKLLADEKNIAQKYLATQAQLLPILRSRLRTVPEWVSAGLLSETAARLCGDEILAFLTGKRGLCVKSNRIGVLTLE